MTVPSSTVPALLQATGRALRNLLVTVAILVLLSMAFVIGRVTVSSSPASVTTPATSKVVPASNDNGICQQVGRLRSAGC
jgi:hypothetical protein